MKNEVFRRKKIQFGQNKGNLPSWIIYLRNNKII